MSPAGFEPTILASDLPQTHALDRAATEILECLTETGEICREKYKNQKHKP
jgi:hypothetical protein